MVITPFIAALLIGSFWTGAAVTGIAAHDGFGLGGSSSSSDIEISASASDHDELCAAKYRSYDADTGMYLSFGGQWKECTLGL
jgi:hypothetical protein